MGAKPAPRWHAKGAEWTGDRLSAQLTAKKAGFKYLDQNFNYFWNDLADHSKGGEAFGLHWGVAEKDNFKHIVDAHTGKVRPMTHEELHRSREDWTADEVKRWRRGATKSSYRPHSYYEHAVHAKEVGITLVAELKNQPFGLKAVAQQLVASAKKAGHRPVFMALWNLAKIKDKVSAFITAGAEFMVIYGHDQKNRAKAHTAIAGWSVKPTWM